MQGWTTMRVEEGPPWEAGDWMDMELPLPLGRLEWQTSTTRTINDPTPPNHPAQIKARSSLNAGGRECLAHSSARTSLGALNQLPEMLRREELHLVRLGRAGHCPCGCASSCAGR